MHLWNIAPLPTLPGPENEESRPSPLRTLAAFSSPQPSLLPCADSGYETFYAPKAPVALLLPCDTGSLPAPGQKVSFLPLIRFVFELPFLPVHIEMASSQVGA